MTEEVSGFPGEVKGPDVGQDLTAEIEALDAKEATKGKWCVAESDGKSLKIRVEGLSLMTDADRWIRDNIENGEVLVPVRLGTPRKLEVITKRKFEVTAI